jgi:hypothetical protein
MSLKYSPRKVPASFFPRNPMISLAPKHNVLWLMSLGYSSFRSASDLNITSVAYSHCAVTQ